MRIRILIGLLLTSACTAGVVAQSLPSHHPGFTRIAILGCHKQFEPAPALHRYVQQLPDLCLWIGDNVYADTEADPTYLKRCYDALAAKPAFQQLREAAPWMATWDDHDFGLNNAGKEYPLKAESKAIFREFWELEAEIPAAQAGIYYARTYAINGKRLQIIMLDVRYERDPPFSGGDVLGEAQWAWLEAQLQQEADLRLLVSGFQLLLDASSGSETWAKFPQAQERLFQLIRTTRAEGVVFLTGDQHYGEVGRRPHTLPYDAVELQFAGINQIESPEFNSHRVSPVIQSQHSYALLDIHWQQTEADLPYLSFRIYDALADELELVYRVNLQELLLQLHIAGAPRFVERQRIQLIHDHPGLEVRYTLDGGEPTLASPVYEQAFDISQSTVLKAQLYYPDGQAASRVFSQSFERVPPLAAVAPPARLAVGLSFRYLEGNFSQLPDFSAQAATKTGIARSLDPMATAEQPDHFAIEYRGYLDIPVAGVYQFFLYSDDGARLYLHDQLVVDNDGSHSARLRQGSLALAKGLHPIRILYFEDYEGQTLQLSYEGPGLSRQPIPFNDFSHE